MNVRTEVIAKIFQAWLKRYSPPNVIKNDADVMKDERDSLLRVILKFAPSQDYDAWVHRALDALEYQMKTRAWPTKSELGAVCANLRKEVGVEAASDNWALNPVKVSANRMNEGKPVGDDYLYGKRCVEMMATGEVDRETLRKYWSAYYFNLKHVLGDEAEAHRIEAEMIAKHEAAEHAHSQATGGKRMVAPTYSPKRFGSAA
ncbi:MAG: hypothetical protein AAFR73_12325 [Pseudomonadota bacterium]